MALGAECLPIVCQALGSVSRFRIKMGRGRTQWEEGKEREGEGRGREVKRRERGEGREREGRGREGGGNGREWKGREEEGENASDSFPGDERGTGLFHLTMPDCPQEQSGQRPDTD